MIASGIFDKMNVFIATYLWELEPNQIRLFRLVGVVAGLTGAILAPTLMRKFDRKSVMLCALFGVGFFAQLVVDLRLLGIAGPTDEAGSPACLFRVVFVDKPSAVRSICGEAERWTVLFHRRSVYVRPTATRFRAEIAGVERTAADAG